MCAELRTVAASNNRDHPTRSLSSSPLASTINCSPGSQVLMRSLTKITPAGSLFYCLFAPHTYIFVLPAHPVRGESHNQRNANGELQQHPLLFTTNHTDRTFFVWRLNSARPPHPGHSTNLMRSEIPSGMSAKLRTVAAVITIKLVAASNNGDHLTRSLYYCLFAPHIHIFVLRAHPVRGESHNQRNATGEVATL